MPILGIIASGIIAKANLMGSFSSDGTLVSAISRPTPLTLGSTIYFVTGDTGGASTNKKISYSSGNGTWSENTSFPYQCLGPIAGVVGSTAYFAAGYSGGTNAYSTTDMSTFTSQTAFPINGLRSACGVGFNSKFYTSGGYSDSSPAGYKRNSYSYSGTTWTSETNYPLDTDTPSLWTFDGTSKYYFNVGDTYYYTGSGSYTLTTAAPVGLNGLFNGQTVYKNRVYLGNGNGTTWYSWNGSGGWRTEVTPSWVNWGGVIYNGILYAKEDGYSKNVYKSVIQ